MAQEYKGEIRGFPEEIVERMLECQVEQGNPKNISVFEHNRIVGSNGKGFTWSKTKEGNDFWNNVIDNKNFDHFYTIYPKSPDIKSEEEFVLPEKWCVKSTTENKEILNDFLSKKGYTYRLTSIAFVHYPFIGGNGSIYSDIQIGYTKITFEQFQKYVLKETSDSRFKVGTWYKSKNWSINSFCKAVNSTCSQPDRIYFSEKIHSGIHEIRQDWWCNRDVTIASLEEIQQYLPDGHPDKITKSSYKIGDRVIATGNISGYENQKGTIVEISDSSHWEYKVCFESTKANIWANVHCLSNEIKSETLIKQVKEGLQLKGRWIKCIKNTTWDTEIKSGEYIQINENNSTIPFVIFKGYVLSFDLSRIDKNEFELMPEGWTPDVKTSSNTDTLVEEIPEYVECTKSSRRSFTVGKIYTWPDPIDNEGIKRSIDILNASMWTFKPSTKESYESQNSKTKIEEWSVGTYVVFLKPFGFSSLGDIDEIIREESRDFSLKCRKEGITTMDSNYTKWFATYEEAKKFSDFLLRTSNFGTGKSASISDLSHNPCREIPLSSVSLDKIEGYPTKESIKTHVIPTNVIDIQLKTKKKKQLFTI